MIRIGFAPAISTSWLGGVNYYSNLFRALAVLDDPAAQIKLFAGPKDDTRWTPAWRGMTVVRSSLLHRGSLVDVARRIDRRLRGRDDLLRLLVRRNGVDALSHHAPIGGGLPVAGWVADLQHRHLPEFFSPEERQQRDRDIERFLHLCDTIFVSSAAARDDMLAYFKPDRARLSVLPFVAAVPQVGAAAAAAAGQRYDLPDHYFHLPNQFWKHKNHVVVLRALRILKERGHETIVVSTGSTSDYRNPGHFDELMRAFADLETSFRVLGVVSLADVYAIMRGAVAVINPSLFEGWSTTVEECKSMGKKVLLSDIPVHREQAPKRAVYFAPDDAEALAGRLLEVFSAHDAAEDAKTAAAAAAELPVRQREFAANYLASMRAAVGRPAHG